LVDDYSKVDENNEFKNRNEDNESETRNEHNECYFVNEKLVYWVLSEKKDKLKAFNKQEYYENNLFIIKNLNQYKAFIN